MIGRAVSWWLGELASILPARLRRAIGPGDPLVVTDGTVLTLPRGRTVPLSEERQVAAIARRVARGTFGVALDVTAGRRLSLDVSLPLKAERNLQDILAFEIGSLTPFDVSDIFWAYEVTGRDRQAGKLAVRVSFLPKVAVQENMDALGAVGLTPQYLRVEGMLLRSSTPGQKRRGAARVLLQAGLVAACVAATAWYGLTDHSLRRASQASQASLDEIRARASALNEAQRQQAPSGAASALFALRESVPSTVDILARLTQALPDDTTLLRLSLSDGRLEISGLSQDAAALVPLLEALPGFTEPQFLAPVRREDGGDLFVLALRVEAPDDV